MKKYLIQPLSSSTSEGIKIAEGRLKELHSVLRPGTKIIFDSIIEAKELRGAITMDGKNFKADGQKAGYWLGACYSITVLD